MNIKSYFILFVFILLITTVVFIIRVPTVNALCPVSLIRSIDYLVEAVDRGANKEITKTLIGKLLDTATGCDGQGNVITGAPRPTDSLNQTPTPGPGTAYPTNNAPTPTPGGNVSGCPPRSELIYVPGTELKYSDWRRSCITPTMIIIHYTVNWPTVQQVLDTLNTRLDPATGQPWQLSCQFTTDEHKTLQMLDFYKDKVEMPACIYSYNYSTINIEIAGENFADIYDNPSHARYNRVTTETNKALEVVCWSMKQYNISIEQIFGHFELQENKQDPELNGAPREQLLRERKYINYFRNRLKSECR